MTAALLTRGDSSDQVDEVLRIHAYAGDLAVLTDAAARRFHAQQGFAEHLIEVEKAP